MKCRRCKATAVVALPSHNTGFCPECFLMFFSRQIERTIKSYKLLTPDDRILVAVSGGKDSLALMLELKLLGYNATGLHVDLGIPGSSEQARATVERFCRDRDIELRVVELEHEGLPIPKVKAALTRPICSACGKIKRYYFNKAAIDGGFTVLATGHNLDDEVSRLFANVLRWDTGYLSDQGPLLPAANGFARKIKPLSRVSEFETANYCFLRSIVPHMSACPYSHGASFTAHKALWADLEERMPGQKRSFYEGFLQRGRQAFARLDEEQGTPLNACTSCGYPTSAETCGVCRVRALLG